MSILKKPALVLLSCLMGSSGARAGSGRELSEYQVKAAFLLNFARFVEWPELNNGTTDPLVIGIFGKNPFGDSLEQVINGKTINGRSLVIRRLSDLASLSGCNLVFFPATDARRFPEAASTLSGLNVLTVGESDNFASRGGMVNFVVKDGRVVFEVNTAAVARAKLKISSKMLQLAILIKEGGQGK